MEKKYRDLSRPYIFACSPPVRSSSGVHGPLCDLFSFCSSIVRQKFNIFQPLVFCSSPAHGDGLNFLLMPCGGSPPIDASSSSHAFSLSSICRSISSCFFSRADLSRCSFRCRFCSSRTRYFSCMLIPEWRNALRPVPV